MNNPNQVLSLRDAQILKAYNDGVKAELYGILTYWMRNGYDPVNGGFIGRIDENNVSCPDSPKGAVLNSRILWAFSAAYAITRDPEHLFLAEIAFKYLIANFMDPEYGGVYWTVTAEGRPLETKKQIYALAFAIYGCAAYFEIIRDEEAKNTAIDLYRLIEAHSFDKENTGYLEAFSREWGALGDLRLSDKDANDKKTMNTHLHILEAYTALYRCWPDEQLKGQIGNLIKNFTGRIVNAETGHLVLFFDEQWNPRSEIISYGHDIEAAWLLWEAARTINELSLTKEVKKISVKLVDAAAEGIDTDGGLWYESGMDSNHTNREKHWWVQAEAMVGFFNCWQMTNDEVYLDRSLQSWHYVNTFIKDKIYGEWLWGRNADGTIMKGQDKAGIWKCPYHNSRACIEIIRRLVPVLNS